MKKTNFPAILEMDRQLYPGLPSEFLKGAHLPLLHRSVHTKNLLCEMNAFHLLCAHPECSLSPETILLVYSAMTKGTALHRELYQKHIIQASGMYYGQKPLEYDSYVRYVTELIAESYQLLTLACKDLTGG